MHLAVRAPGGSRTLIHRFLRSAALPVGYHRGVVLMAGVEPAASHFSGGRSTELSYNSAVRAAATL